jgi:hypothetical protein
MVSAVTSGGAKVKGLKADVNAAGEAASTVAFPKI